jgi:cytochrome c556
MLETQIQKISVAIPSQSNGDSSKTPIKESVRSIFTVFKENAPKPTKGSLGGVGKDKKPSAAEKFSPNFSQYVKNATSTATSSPVTPAT